MDTLSHAATIKVTPQNEINQWNRNKLYKKTKKFTSYTEV